MIDLGSELREAREAKGISLAEAEAETRIRERYLQALESNDWAALPTMVQARGFLRNYAAFLGLDQEHIMSAFGQAMRASGMVPPPATPQVRTADQNGTVFEPRDIDIERGRGLPAWLGSDILLGIALAVVVALIGFGLLRLVVGDRGGSNTPQATLGPTQALPAGGSPAQTASPAVATPTFDTSTGGVTLDLEATEHVWVRVTVDGVPVLEGVLAPGAPQSWQGQRQIMLETANGAGLKAVVNGQPQGPLGERGQTLKLIWGPGGLLPTPGATP